MSDSDTSSRPSSSPSPLPSPSPSPSSSQDYDDSSEIDELDYRSRKLNKLLKKNVNKAERRKRLLDVVRNRAWVLEDQVNLLERQTKSIKESLASKSLRRNLIVFTAAISSLALLGLGVSHVVHHGSDEHDSNSNSNIGEINPS
jgi:hypothetical protein